MSHLQIQTPADSIKESGAYFGNSMEHLLAELERVDILIQHVLRKVEHLFSGADNYRGLYITEGDTRALLHKPIGEPWWSILPPAASEPDYRTGMDAILKKIEQKKIHAREKGIKLRLEKLLTAFGLDDVEKDILLICIAPEIDIRYERLFAYLQDDITKKYPSIDLIANLLCASAYEKFELRKRFSPDAGLIKHKLINLTNEPTNSCQVFLDKTARIPYRVSEFLFGNDQLDEAIDYCTRRLAGKNEFAENAITKELRQTLLSLANKVKNNNEKAVFYLQGPPGAGRQDMAQAVSREIGFGLLAVDLTLALKNSAIEFNELLGAIIRETYLQDANLYLAGFDAILGDVQETLFLELMNIIHAYNGVVFLAGTEHWEPKSIFEDRTFYRIVCPELTSRQRSDVWKKLLARYNCILPNQALSELASRFCFTHGQIRDAVETARNIALSINHETPRIGIEEIYQACHVNTNRKLALLAKKICPKYTWDDITLVDDKRRQLREMHNTVRHRTLVYEQWGFADKLSLGKGLNALFSGPPGTGKTMAAEIVANSLGLELYKIDLSLLVSKYIGETEKNLSRIFAEAETSNVILFFDEADALFGKRTDIKNSHDRYANVEVAYLLQKMEEYAGVTILATNLRNNMDEAFVRRLTFIIDFPFPDKAERKNIWQSIWPTNTPLSTDLDLDFMSSQFKLAGGNIKNIALAASFLAAEEGSAVGMRHLLLSTKREFEKQGRACVKADFGQYGELLQ